MAPKIVCLCVCLAIVSILKSVEGQICRRRTVAMKTISVPYWATYREKYRTTCWYGSCTKTRIRNRLEHRTETRQEVKYVNECCVGYIREDSGEDEDDIECKPICMPSCKHGNCTRPGVCTCNVGYAPDSNHKYQCNPVCDEGCDNGSCVGPDTCECNFGYHQPNETCIPICTRPCANGSCIAPETCECDSGFRKSETNTCQPYCSKGCINGSCVEPEVCNCNPGYLKDLNGNCIPHCNQCNNGTCVEPNTCICDTGYVLLNETCQPNCTDPCENGNCIAPNICECNPGYRLLDGMCEPVCTPPCENGTCITPNKCRCHVGHRNTEENVCTPHCSKGCNNGTCVEPEVCNCYPGFVSNTDENCVPYCNQCSNGTCIAPDTCICDSGYRKSESDICEPHCSKGCQNGTCIEPDICKCDPGYEKKDENCKPYCNQCNNGTCVAPETCMCKAGYKKSEENVCEPHCSKGCTNGTCVEPDVCKCNEGYKIESSIECTSSIDCRTVCFHDNSTCFQNHCDCHSEILNNETFSTEYAEDVCKPICHFCEGICVEPNKCVCAINHEPKYLGADGGPCDCFFDCSEKSKKCERTICLKMDNISGILTTDNINETLNLNEKEFELSEEHDFESRSNFSSEFGPIDEDKYFTYENVTGNKDSNRMITAAADKHKKEKESHPIWIYAVASVFTVLLIVAIILFIKRNSISRYFKGGSYIIANDL